MKFYSRLLLLAGVVILFYYSLRVVSTISEQRYLKYASDIDKIYQTSLHVKNLDLKHTTSILNLALYRPPKNSINISEMEYFDEREIAQIYISEETNKNYITPIDSVPIILNENICKNDNTYLIIMVPSIPSHAKHRQAIRETYAQLSRDNIKKVNGVEIPYIIRTMFLLGRGEQKLVDESVLRENSNYKDIVQFDFIDSYHNLTLKILHGFQWINHYCKQAKYVLKSDEDVFVNVALLIQQLESYNLSQKGVIFGYIYSSSKVWRFGKWAIDKSVYDKDFLPRYASGTAYVVSVNILPSIVKEAKKSVYIQVEDAFITGIIASEKLGASLVMLNGSSHLIERRLEPCDFVISKRVTKTNLKYKELYSFWNALLSFEKECHMQMPVLEGL